MARAGIVISIVVISVLADALPSDRIAFGQGSIGGTLGKTDKSLSGGHETAPPKDAARPDKNTAEALEHLLRDGGSGPRIVKVGTGQERSQ